MEEEYLAAEEQFFIFQDFFDFTTIIDYLKCDVINKYNKSVDEGVKWLISLLDENLIIICKKNPARNRFCYITECIFAKREMEFYLKLYSRSDLMYRLILITFILWCMKRTRFGIRILTEFQYIIMIKGLNQS